MAWADDNAGFYAGKTISLLVGSSAGGGYDLYARLLARHMASHIPGHPTIVVQNMTGAGTLRLALYMYSVAAKDGTVIGSFSRSVPFAPLMGLPGANFDPMKYLWLGSIATDSWTCIAWKDAPVRSWHDLLTTDFTVGGMGKTSDPDVYARLVTNAFNAKIKLVTGYPGTDDIALAVQRREVDGICGYSVNSLFATHGDWIADRQVTVLVQGALKPDPRLPGVPSILDEATSDSQRAMLRLALAPQAMARAFVLPPGTREDRVATLRQAFAETMTDPAFLAEAKGRGLDVDPLTGEQVLALLKDAYATPPDVVQQAQKVMGYGP
jgi:tripartite-type tricarboxylate transporter receptor subunit TctC